MRHVYSKLYSLDNGVEIRYTDKHKQFDLISFHLFCSWLMSRAVGDRVMMNYEFPCRRSLHSLKLQKNCTGNITSDLQFIPDVKYCMKY
jgi:hypothetical protein